MGTRYLNIVTAKQFGLDVAEGNIEGVEPIRRFGHNLAVPATYETVWCHSSLYVYMTTANRLLITSDSAQDGVAGTGTLTLQLSGLDEDYNILTETITMNGVAAVQTKGSFLRLFTTKSITAGTNGINVGNITITDSTTVITAGYLQAGEGKTLNAFWTTPADKTSVILDATVGEMAQKQTDFALFMRPFGQSWYIGKTLIVKNQTIYELLSMPIKVPAKMDIEVRAKSSGGSGIVMANFSGYYK